MIEALRLRGVHGAATVTGIFWDKERQRIGVSLLYDDGATDWIPTSEVDHLYPGSNITRRAFAVINK